MSMDASSENIGSAGVKLIAEALRTSVTGGLTSINLSGNQLCGIWTYYGGQRGAYTAKGITAIADALCVNGGLTSLDLSNNALCGVTYKGGTYTAEGITALADALRVNGGLTALDLSFNDMGEEGKASICFAAQGKAGFNLHL
eukprot:jgi/Chrpa1/26629/Chrysochromulina_OHIO_Genome00006376-RA